MSPFIATQSRIAYFPFRFAEEILWQSKFHKLQESGLLSLQPNGFSDSKADLFVSQISTVRIPFIFILLHVRYQRSPLSQFFTEILLRSEITSEEWESFNRNYIALRLAMFRHLGYTSISLDRFFTGAKMDVKRSTIVIPSNIEVIDVTSRFPPHFPEDHGQSQKITEKTANLNVIRSNYGFPTEGLVTKNASGVPFDAYVFLNSSSGKNVVMSFQMKLQSHEANKPEFVRDKMVSEECEEIRMSLHPQDKMEEGKPASILNIPTVKEEENNFGDALQLIDPGIEK